MTISEVETIDFPKTEATDIIFTTMHCWTAF